MSEETAGSFRETLIHVRCEIHINYRQKTLNTLELSRFQYEAKFQLMSLANSLFQCGKLI